MVSVNSCGKSCPHSTWSGSMPHSLRTTGLKVKDQESVLCFLNFRTWHRYEQGNGHCGPSLRPKHWSLSGSLWPRWPFHKLCNIRRIILERSKAKLPFSVYLFSAWTPPQTFFCRLWVVCHWILWEKGDPVSSLSRCRSNHRASCCCFKMQGIAVIKLVER